MSSSSKMMTQGDDVFQPLGHFHYQAIMAAAENEVSMDTENYFRKALTAGTAASGEEFVPTQYSPRFIKYIYLKSWARQAFGTWVIQFGDTMKVPKFDSALTPDNPDYITENTTVLGSATAIRESAETTTEVTLELKTIAINRQVQRRFLDYNIVPRGQMEAYLREIVIKTLTEAEEDVIVNGDTTSGASNINNAYDASNHPHGYDSTHNEHLITFNGLRHEAGGTNVDVSGSLTAANFRTAIKNLGRYGADPSRVIFLVSLDARASILGFSQLETLDKYGPRATILSGEVGNFYGSRVIVTDKLPNTAGDTLTNSSGIRSSSTATNTKTECMAIFVESPMIGVPANQNSALNVTVKQFPEFDRQHLIGREDFAFAIAYTDGIVRLINITP